MCGTMSALHLQKVFTDNYLFVRWQEYPNFYAERISREWQNYFIQ